MSATALIFGISGQDGSLLAKYLLGRGWRVVGTSRNAGANDLRNLDRIGIRDAIGLRTVDLADRRSIMAAIEATAPDHIYNMSGQSSVGLSFEQPIATLEANVGAPANILEAIRTLRAPVRFYNAASSDSFGETPPGGADEATPFRPSNPYAASKAAAYWMVASYRAAYGLFAVSAILFNHESPLRSERFVTRKIVKGAVRLAKGADKGSLELGNLDVTRDWGWAEEFVEAIHLMLLNERPEDFVLATGRHATLRDFTAEVFAALGLDWKDHVVSRPDLKRPADIIVSTANPARAGERLGWRARVFMPEVARRLVQAELGERHQAELRGIIEAETVKAGRR